METEKKQLKENILGFYIFSWTFLHEQWKPGWNILTLVKGKLFKGYLFFSLPTWANHDVYFY